MKPLPVDAAARHRRFIAALCDDLASRDFLRTGRTPRADAVVATSRRMEAALIQANANGLDRDPNDSRAPA